MAQIGFKNSSTAYSCIALYSSKLGYGDPEDQKSAIRAYAENAGVKIESYVDSSGYDDLPVEEIARRFGKVQQSLVLIWRLDCLPLAIKSLEDFFRLLASLGKKGTTLISTSEGLDTDLPAQTFSVILDKAWQDFKKNRKITNARATSLKVKKKGVAVKTGRKKLRDDSQIHALRASGLTIREIASNIKLSTTAVQRSLKSSSGH